MKSQTHSIACRASAGSVPPRSSIQRSSAQAAASRAALAGQGTMPKRAASSPAAEINPNRCVAPLPANVHSPARHHLGWQPRGSQMAKTPLEIASLARMHTKKAVRTLAAIMNEPRAPYAARVAAAEALLARGWGKPTKTDGVLGEFGAHASRYGKDAIGLMVRRTRAELVETIERSREIYGPLGWKLNDTEKMWRAPDGARLRFAYLERDADADMYQGHNYTRVYVEEVGNFPSPAPVMKLMATLRSGAGVPVGLRATGNPGGPGHQWVKTRYIDPAPLGNRIIRDPVTGLERVFIPSKVDNNQYIDVEAYKQQLRASGSKELVRAWLDGDWSVTMGRSLIAGIPSGMWWHRLPSRRNGCGSGPWTGARPCRSRLVGGPSCKMTTPSTGAFCRAAAWCAIGNGMACGRASRMWA